ADCNREDHVAKKDLAEPFAEGASDDVWQAPGVLAEFWGANVTDGHQAKEHEESTCYGRRRKRLKDRARRRPARVRGFFSKRTGGVEAVHDVGCHDHGREEGAKIAEWVGGSSTLGVEHDGRPAHGPGRQENDER